MLRRSAISLLCLLAATGAEANVDNARAQGLAWLVQTQRGDGSFAGAKGMDVQATAAAVEAMRIGGLSKSPQYARALSWLANVQAGSLDAQAWQTMAMAQAGRDAATLGNAVLNARNMTTWISGSGYANMVAWGPFAGYAASVPDTALGYAAVRAAGLSDSNDKTEFTRSVQCLLIPSQLTAAPWKGSWPYALPQLAQPAGMAKGSILATAVLLHELKTSRLANRFLTDTYYCGNRLSTVDTAMANAKTWLIAQANSNGGFAERNPQSGALEASNPVVTALAIRALALFAAEGDAAANAAVNNARNWLSGQQAGNGSWRGDPFVTARVLAALPPATGAHAADSDGDGLTDVVEARLGTQSAYADAQSQINHGGNALPGITVTSFAANGMVGQPFSFNLNSIAGGGGAYTYSLANGALPPGITLASSGTLGGTPTTAGSFAFDFEAASAGSGATLIIGRIDIAALTDQGGDGGDVPLPGWALLLLGGGLLAAMRRRATRAIHP